MTAKLLSPKEVAAELGCSRKTIERDFKRGIFPNAMQMAEGRAIRIPESDVTAIKAKSSAKAR